MIRCVEWDAGKAAAAGKLMQGVSQVTVVEGDARIAELGTPDAICMFDVLHYSPVEVRQAGSGLFSANALVVARKGR